MNTSRIQEYCKLLNLGYIGQVYEQISADTPEEYLLKCLEAEVESRRNTKIERLIKKAGFSQWKTLEDYEFPSLITLPSSTTVEELKDLMFLEKKRNIMMIGTMGTGKTDLSIALGIEACRRGKEVGFYRVGDLVSKLLEKQHNGGIGRFIRDIQKAELIILDELGFIPFHKDGAELLFSLIAECYEQTSIIVTSNSEFGQTMEHHIWGISV